MELNEACEKAVRCPKCGRDWWYVTGYPHTYQWRCGAIVSAFAKAADALEGK